ncbi:MAG: hypothetical protein J5840_00320 [Lachnospiraceae bacterium]|nr:hypothetical protein [Lachnospiraceae bacterium]
MDKKERSILPPKGVDGRYRDIMILHIQGIVMVLILLIALWGSFSILGRSIIALLLSSVSGSVNPDDISSTLELAGMGDFAFVGDLLKFLSGTLGVLSYIVTFGALAVSIILIIKMKKRIAEIVDDKCPYENPIRVKKAKFVWLGFLLGAYGGHLFALGKRKGWIYLIMGILGIEFFPLFIYTSGISFADAFMACFIEKDDEGYIEMEDYPYWI